MARIEENVLTRAPWNIVKTRKLVWIDEIRLALPPQDEISNGAEKLCWPIDSLERVACGVMYDLELHARRFNPI